MLGPCWLLVAAVMYVCIPGSWSVCWENSICTDLSNKERILECIHFCMSVIQTETPELRDDDLLFNIIMDAVPSEGESLESDLKAHNDERRSYTMEHFRWGKPSIYKSQDPKLGARSNERRSYSMEHFRWGKPPGRKRKPVKVFAFSLDGEGSSEGSFPVYTRRQLSNYEDNTKEDADRGSHQKQALLRARDSTNSHNPLGLQERKDGTYKMSHFRWGSPPVSKRNGSVMKLWEGKPRGLLTKFFRNITVKDLQRIMSKMKHGA
ncbi:pro-opiomelanocortin-like [Pholidichthys leucotaenia]